MYVQYMNQAQAKLAYLATDELRDLLNDETKIEDRVTEVVSLAHCVLCCCNHLSHVFHSAENTRIRKGHHSECKPIDSRRKSST